MVERPPPTSISASSKQAEGSGFESQVVRYFGNDQDSGLNSLLYLLLFRWPLVPHEDPPAIHVEFGHDLSSAFGNAVRSSGGLGFFRRLDRLFLFVEGNMRGVGIYCFEVVHVGCLVAVQVPVVHIDSMELLVLRGGLANCHAS
jgi:hypothetical protein